MSKQRFEYALRQNPYHTPPNSDYLNEWAREGWQVVGVLPSTASDAAHYILERPFESGPQNTA